MSIVRCELHGLNYDNESQTGCVVCRRGSKDPAGGTGGAGAKFMVGMIGLVVVGGAAIFGANAFMESQRARIGEVCTGTFGCEQGAECRGPIMATSGTCMKRCSHDPDCADLHNMMCGDGFCVEKPPERSVGMPCDQRTVCAGDAQCVEIAGSGFRCYATCNSEADCSASTTCRPMMMASTSNLAMPSMSMASFCVPK